MCPKMFQSKHSVKISYYDTLSLAQSAEKILEIPYYKNNMNFPKIIRSMYVNRSISLKIMPEKCFFIRNYHFFMNQVEQ